MADSARRRWLRWLAVSLLAIAGVVMLALGVACRLIIEREVTHGDAWESNPVFLVLIDVHSGQEQFAFCSPLRSTQCPMDRRLVWLSLAAGMTLALAALLARPRFSLRFLVICMVCVALVGALPFTVPVRNAPSLLQIRLVGDDPLTASYRRIEPVLHSEAIIEGMKREYRERLAADSPDLFKYISPEGPFIEFHTKLPANTLKPPSCDFRLQYWMSSKLTYEQQVALTDYLVDHLTGQLAMDWLDRTPGIPRDKPVEWLMWSAAGSAFGSDWKHYRAQWWRELAATHQAKP